MNQPIDWSQQIDLCISSPAEFISRCSNILSNIQSNDPSYWDIFFQKISTVIPKKYTSATARFHALYLLFIATETCSARLGARLSQESELLTFIAESALHEANNRSIAPEQRGKYFFSFLPSSVEERTGIKFVHLCLECIIIWQHNFGKQDKNHPCYIFDIHCEDLRRKIRFPSHYSFIGRNNDPTVPISHKTAPKKFKAIVEKKINTDTVFKLLKHDEPSQTQSAQNTINPWFYKNPVKPAVERKATEKTPKILVQEALSNQANHDDDGRIKNSPRQTSPYNVYIQDNAEEGRQEEPLRQKLDYEDFNHLRSQSLQEALNTESLREKLSRQTENSDYIKEEDLKHLNIKKIASGSPGLEKNRATLSILDVKERVSTSLVSSQHFNSYSSPKSLQNSKVYQERVATDLEAISNSLVKSQGFRSSNNIKSKFADSTKNINSDTNNKNFSERVSMIFEDRRTSSGTQNRLFSGDKSQFQSQSQQKVSDSDHYLTVVGKPYKIDNSLCMSPNGVTSLGDFSHSRVATPSHHTSYNSRMEDNINPKGSSDWIDGSLNEILSAKWSNEGQKSSIQMEGKSTNEPVSMGSDQSRKTFNLPMTMTPRRPIVRFGLPSRSSE